MSGPNTTSRTPLSTADLASAARSREVLPDEEPVAVIDDDDDVIPGSARPNEARVADEALVALFTPDVAETYRSRWTAVQSSFVDDPRQAVRSGDELVAEIMTNLANSFADERQRVEDQLDETGEGSTENLRLALRRYRSFFERLLSL